MREVLEVRMWKCDLNQKWRLIQTNNESKKKISKEKVF